MAVKTNCTKNGKDYYRVTATVGKKLTVSLYAKNSMEKAKKKLNKNVMII